MATSDVLVALVTGASRGIGRATAEKLATRGLRVALHFRSNHEAVDEVRRACAGAGHATFAADLGSRDAPQALFDQVLEKMGRIDVLVNSAGIFEVHPIESVDYEGWQSAWERTLALNLAAPAMLSFLVAHHLSRCGGGRIINLSSRGAFGGQTKTAAYSASKAGLNSLGHSIAAAFARQQVLVFGIAPGWVDTDMAAPHIHGPNEQTVRDQIPLGRVATAEEIGRVAAWLALDAPPSMTGCIVDANGGVLLRP